jgi:hypothetical protein
VTASCSSVPATSPYFADHVGIVTSVGSDGTIDMVNGDFAATPDVHVEYDTDITSLSAFAAAVEGPGEEWAVVTPPTTAQQPRPTGSLSGPAVADLPGQPGLADITPVARPEHHRNPARRAVRARELRPPAGRSIGIDRKRARP